LPPPWPCPASLKHTTEWEERVIKKGEKVRGKKKIETGGGESLRGDSREAKVD